MPSDERMRRWQLLRRGRYVEFNLVCERGIKFGLAAPGVNVENVLMGMPETARWEYMSDMFEESDSDEGKMMEVLKSPKSWVQDC
jgi:coproporphyrinogen III oxidase